MDANLTVSPSPANRVSQKDSHGPLESPYGRGIGLDARQITPDIRTTCWSPKPKELLSSREAEVLTWLAAGKSGPDIALILGISVCTVRLHIQSIKRKLNASNIPHAVSYGFAMGILSPAVGTVSP